MEDRLQYDSHAVGAARTRIRIRVLASGLVAGLAATIVIDLITAGVLPLMGSPADSGFAVIGDTTAGFFSLFGIDVAGGVALGLVLHYLIGLALGVLFAAAVNRIDALRLNTVRKSLALGVLYTEAISLPIVVTPPLILRWSTPDAIQWFGFSVVMHMIWGLVLGYVVSRGLRSATEVGQG